MVLVYSLLAGLVIGLLSGGRLERLSCVGLRWAPLAIAGLLFQVALFSEPVASRVGAAGPPLYVASTVVVLAVLVANLRQPWLGLLALGAALNLLVIVANGGVMPADPAAFAALRGTAVLPSAAPFSNSVPLPDAALRALGDVFVTPVWLPFANVFSVGDVLIGVGAAAWLVAVLRRAPGAPATSPDSSR